MACMDYKGTGRIHTFRGLLADGGQDKISIQGATGDIAWRIAKLQIISNLSGTGGAKESTIQIWREEQSSVSTTASTVDFTNDELLAVAFYKAQDSPVYASTHHVIFDNTLFVRNIWATHTNTDGSVACNYYIELEEVKVSKASMAQLAVAAARRDPSLA